jgi:hypothetical protein
MVTVGTRPDGLVAMQSTNTRVPQKQTPGSMDSIFAWLWLSVENILTLICEFRVRALQHQTKLQRFPLIRLL